MASSITNRVTLLITAESIIAGFMITYGALNGQMLFNWSQVRGASGALLMTTYIAGIMTYGIVLTCLVSIILLFNSLPTDKQIKKEKNNLLWRYNACSAKQIQCWARPVLNGDSWIGSLCARWRSFESPLRR